MTSLATRQFASAFNQPLDFDTSSVTDMSDMFGVRALAPNLRPSPSLFEVRSSLTLHLTASRSQTLLCMQIAPLPPHRPLLFSVHTSPSLRLGRVQPLCQTKTSC